MFKLFRSSGIIAEQSVTRPKVRAIAVKGVSLKERHRLADTDGNRRRMLQTIEDNRLR
ncbi:hypothetical protein [Mesorhizobium marinum]|uniref:hypothetical protein n=1 Tax=Mesorhizobium marinum TaxID=3228790 RepID=UPI0034650007